MTTPVGDSWTHVVSLVDKHKGSFPADEWPWIAALLEDAWNGCKWFEATALSKGVHNIAAHYLDNFDEAWSRDDGSLHKRMFSLFIGGVANDPARVQAYVDSLIARVRAAPARRRDFKAEERLAFTLKFANSTAPSALLPDAVWAALVAMHIRSGADEDEDIRRSDWRRGASFGIRDQGVSPFFPASCMSGPFRHLLNYRPRTALRFIVSLANDAAAHFRAAATNSVVVIAPQKSPNGKEHLHSDEFWLCYRGLAVTDDLLASALMALEERLLFDAESDPAKAGEYLTWLLDNGTSTLTTAVAASVVAAHPRLFAEQFLRLARCQDFFLADRRRLSGEHMPLAILGGHDGLDAFRQRERHTSNSLPHRKRDLEAIALQLQVENVSRSEIFAALDEHIRELAAQAEEERDDTWRVALKRMDLRGLKVGPPVGDGRYRALEIAELDEDLAEQSKVAEMRAAHANRRAGLHLWAASATGRRQKDAEPLFRGPSEVLEALRQVHEQEEEDEAEIYAGFDQEVAAGLILEMFQQDASCDEWATAAVSAPRLAQLRAGRDVWGGVARAIVRLLALRPGDAGINDAVAEVAFHKDPEIRSAFAEAVNGCRLDLGDQVVITLASGLARYAELAGEAAERTWPRRERAYRAARRLARWELLRWFGGTEPLAPALGDVSAHIGDWVLALRAAQGLPSWEWRRNTLNGLVELAAVAESSRSRDPEVDFTARTQIEKLFASELLRRDDGGVEALSRLKGIIPRAPEFSNEVLQDLLLVVDASEHKDSHRFWAVWDAATSVVFSHPQLRAGRSSRFERLVRQLLLVGVPWRDGAYHHALLNDRPTYATDSLRQVGDTHAGLQGCLDLLASVGRQSSIPSALPALRDAVLKQGVEAFTPRNNQWNAELVCRLAVHQHRDELMRSKLLREATLDVLTALVDAGSSIGFQLRDYLATASTRA